MDKRDRRKERRRAAGQNVIAEDPADSESYLSARNRLFYYLVVVGMIFCYPPIHADQGSI